VLSASTGAALGARYHRQGRSADGTAASECRAPAKALRLSLREIATRLAEQGYTVAPGKPYAAMSVQGMLRG
jgi:hypothetical protein